MRTEAPGQQFCFCHDEISLQSVAGGAHPNGLYSSVWLRVNGKSCEYVQRNEQNQLYGHFLRESRETSGNSKLGVAVENNEFTQRPGIQLAEVGEIIPDSPAEFPPRDLYITDQEAMQQLVDLVHQLNARWWADLKTGEPINRNVGEMLMLVASELGEALEAHRKDLMDDKLPHRRGIEVEIADAIIRLLDMAGGLQLDVAGALVEKLVYNANREDHTREHRLSEHGKKY